MSFRKYLFLFDIDGTLISPGGVSRGLLAKAVTEKTGEKVHLGYNDVAGYTDRSIVRNALLKLNQTITADLLDSIFQYYVSLMKSELWSQKTLLSIRIVSIFWIKCKMQDTLCVCLQGI